MSTNTTSKDNTTSRELSFFLSKYVAMHELATDRHAIWNSFFPSPLVIDDRTLELLRGLPGSAVAFDPDSMRRFVQERIIYCGIKDPYAEEFFLSAEAALATAENDAERFYRERLSYATLSIVNSGCNLGCSYCVSYAGDSFRTGAARVADKGDGRISAVMDVVDQFILRRVQNGEDDAAIFFNGGEILLRWPLIRQVLRHVRDAYPQIKATYSMNTNATLITDEIAQGLAEFDVEIHVSIDGHKDLHDSSRVQHGGAPSFEQVMQGVGNYNRHNPDRAITTFQGTIEDVGKFDVSEFVKMKRLGFASARLAPNVLDASPDKGAVAATWEANAVLDTQESDVNIENTYFHRVLEKMGERPKGFSPNCHGLSGNLKAVVLNVDSLQVSQMCSFVSPASLPLADLQYNIYHPRLWTQTIEYVRGRIEMLRRQCAGCNVLGLCQGACIYNGLNLDNKLNPAGCSYQRTMWRHALDLSFLGCLRSSEEHVAADGENTAPAAGDVPTVERGCSNDSTRYGPTREVRGRRYFPLTPVS